MNYGYIRVSTDKQTVENQRFEIDRFCEKEGISIDRWIEETISGTKEPDKRKLGKFLKKMHKGDVLICAELSRLGRSLLMIMAILNDCLNREAQVWTIKDNYRLGSDISSKVLAFAFGLSAAFCACRCVCRPNAARRASRLRAATHRAWLARPCLCRGHALPVRAFRHAARSCRPSAPSRLRVAPSISHRTQ